MIPYIDEQRGSFGVEPICRTLQVAPSSYYAAKTRPPSARTVRDEALTDTLVRIHRAHFGVYGVRKAWRTLQRMGIPAGRDQVARLNRPDSGGDSIVWRNMESWHKNALPASGGIHRNCENERSGWWPRRPPSAVIAMAR